MDDQTSSFQTFPENGRVQSLSCVQLFATLWTVAHQASARGTLQARILEWVSNSSSSGSPQPGDGAHASCVPALAGSSLPLSRLEIPAGAQEVSL